MPKAAGGLPIYGAVVRGLREARGLSQGQLEVKSGVSQEQISRIESAEVTASRRKTVAALAEALGADLDTLAGRTAGAPEPTPLHPRPVALPDVMPTGWGATIRKAVIEGFRQVQSEVEEEPEIHVQLIDTLRPAATESGWADDQVVRFKPPSRKAASERVYVAFKVSGACMSPEIEHGDTVIVEQRDPDDFHDGEIVFTAHQGSVMIKRLALIDGREHLVANDGTTIPFDPDSTRPQGVVVETRRSFLSGPPRRKKKG